MASRDNAPGGDLGTFPPEGGDNFKFNEYIYPIFWYIRQAAHYIVPTAVGFSQNNICYDRGRLQVHAEFSQQKLTPKRNRMHMSTITLSSFTYMYA